MSNREVIHRALECFADPAQRSRYFDLYAEDIVVHGYVGVDPGLESVKQYYETFWYAFPDSQVKAEEIVEQGDRVALRLLITGTHLGPFLGIAPTGRTVSFAGMTILRFRGGKCVERWSVTDAVSLLIQLGLHPIPN